VCGEIGNLEEIVILASAQQEQGLALILPVPGIARPRLYPIVGNARGCRQEREDEQAGNEAAMAVSHHGGMDG
jgi:hypothetical protein